MAEFNLSFFYYYYSFHPVFCGIIFSMCFIVFDVNEITSFCTKYGVFCVADRFIYLVNFIAVVVVVAVFS